MRYGQLIRDAWQITWRHPFLWMLGLFAGGTASASISSRGNPSSSLPDGRVVPRLNLTPDAVMAWASAHVGLIVSVAVTVALVGLVLLAISLIAQGGMARATADFASGGTSTLGRAVGTGLHLFWRYAGLWLLLIVAATVVAATVAGAVALIVGLTVFAEQSAWVVAPAVLVGLVLLVAGIVAGVAVSIVVPLAQRAIAVRDVGPLAALRDGWRVLRSRPGASLLVWLIDVGLTLATGLLIAMAVIAVVLVLAIPAVLLWYTFAFTTPTIVYLAFAGLAVLGVLLAMVSVTNTFFWSYWTLAYLRLGADTRSGTAA
jgi:hypothetical protein